MVLIIDDPQWRQDPPWPAAPASPIGLFVL